MELMLYAKSICWIDDCRIPFVDNDKPTGGFGAARIGYGNEYEYDGECGKANTKGRFPANILVSDDMLNDGKLSTSEGGKTKRNTAHFGAGTFNMEGYGDKGTNSRYYDIDKWFDNLLESCE